MPEMVVPSEKYVILVLGEAGWLTVEGRDDDSRSLDAFCV